MFAMVDFNLTYFAHKPWRSLGLKKTQRRYGKTQCSQWLILFAMVDFNLAYFGYKPWRSLRLKKNAKAQW